MNSQAVCLEDGPVGYKKTDLVVRDFFSNDSVIEHFFSPARVNLIGEHIDYCGGKVLPCAINLGIRFSVARNARHEIAVYSFNSDDVVRIPLQQPLRASGNGHWSEYVKGVIQSYELELPLQGLDIALDSDIPGGGLSSSAALEVGLAYILESYFHPAQQPDDQDRRKAIAWRTQRVENEFVGVNCGIMDQAAVALGSANNAIEMDCQNLQIKAIPARLGPYQLVICNTNKDRKLADSKYNERRAEVEQALAIIQQAFNIQNLCDITELQKCQALALITDSVIQNRARHVVEENIRVAQAANSLALGGLKEFGRLLNDSHQSLKNLYDVSCAELDFIAENAVRIPGVIGARMTGAGFGGCAILLVHEAALNSTINKLSRDYYNRFGFSADFYPVSIGNGTHHQSNTRT